MVQLLLQHGADVNAKNACASFHHCAYRSDHILMRHRENTTALHVAVNLNHLSIVRVLLQFGADANAVAKCDDSDPMRILAALLHSLTLHLLQE